MAQVFFENSHCKMIGRGNRDSQQDLLLCTLCWPQPRTQRSQGGYMAKAIRTDTARGVTTGGGGKTGPSPELRRRVVSGDRNRGDPQDKKKPRDDEQRRSKKNDE